MKQGDRRDLKMKWLQMKVEPTLEIQKIETQIRIIHQNLKQTQISIKNSQGLPKINYLPQ